MSTGCPEAQITSNGAEPRGAMRRIAIENFFFPDRVLICYRYFGGLGWGRVGEGWSGLVRVQLRSLSYVCRCKQVQNNGPF
jgi:hypothetical protein